MNEFKSRNIRKRNVANVIQQSRQDESLDLGFFFQTEDEDGSVLWSELSDAAESDDTQPEGRNYQVDEHKLLADREDEDKDDMEEMDSLAGKRNSHEAIAMATFVKDGEQLDQVGYRAKASKPSVHFKSPGKLKALLKLKIPKKVPDENDESAQEYPESPSPPPPTPEMTGKKGRPKLERMQSRGVIVVGLQKHMRRNSFLSDVNSKMQILTIDRQQAEMEVLMDRLIADQGTKEKALLYVVKEVFPESKVQQLVVALLQRGALPNETDTDDRSPVFHAVNRNFTQVLRKLLEAKASTHIKDKRGETPIQKAIDNKNDDMAALLVAYSPNAAVRSLFTTQGRKPAKFSFHKLLQSSLQQTILGVLDCLLDPMPSGKVKVHYHLLECDDAGRSPKSSSYKTSSKSSLHVMAVTHNKDAISHNAVQLLIKRKWQTFARFRFILNALLYLVSLFVMTFALVVGAMSPDPLAYGSPIHYARAVAEVYTCIFVFANLILEFIQFYRNRTDYFRDPFNWVDVSSALLLLIVVPLRFTVTAESWPVFGVGYFLWTMRTFKYSAISRSTGAFAQILWSILTKDMVQFVAVFLVVLLAFSGLLIAGLAYEGTLHDAMKLPWETKSFWTTLLSGTRTLVEQQPVVDYIGEDGLGPFSVTVMLMFLFATLVVLLNILIARLSDTYQNVQRDAQRELELGRAWSITQLERDSYFSDPRKKFYEPEEVMDDVLAELEKWESQVISDRTQMLTDVQDKLEQQDLYMLSLGQRLHTNLRLSHGIQARLADMQRKLETLVPGDERDSGAYDIIPGSNLPSLSIGSSDLHRRSGPSNQELVDLRQEMLQIRHLMEDIKEQRQA